MSLMSGIQKTSKCERLYVKESTTKIEFWLKNIRPIWPIFYFAQLCPFAKQFQNCLQHPHTMGNWPCCECSKSLSNRKWNDLLGLWNNLSFALWVSVDFKMNLPGSICVSSANCLKLPFKHPDTVNMKKVKVKLSRCLSDWHWHATHILWNIKCLPWLQKCSQHWFLNNFNAVRALDEASVVGGAVMLTHWCTDTSPGFINLMLTVVCCCQK